MKEFIEVNALEAGLMIVLIWIVLTIFVYENKRYGKHANITRSRHKRKIKKAEDILKKFKQFPEEAKVPKVLTYLRKIDPYVFEELLLSAFEKQGYKIERGKRYSGDGGIDGKMFKDGNLYYIQAKRYSGYVKKQHIQDFIEITGDHVKGLFIHTGKTGKELFQIIPPNIQIISGHKLVKLLETQETPNH